jgi:threonine/homoserine/homoserine lactone efflux protein
MRRRIRNLVSDSLLKGLALGFSIAAPVGPIGVLCIRRTLAEGRAAGMLTGMGAATADAIYGCIAAFGLTAVSALLVSHVFYLRLVGGLFLCSLGIKTLLAQPNTNSALASSRGLAGAYASTFALTLSNPMTILAFLAIFGGLGLPGAESGSLEAAAMVAGVFAGSMLWWTALTLLVSLLRDRLTPRHILWINRASGVLIFGFGILALSGILR